MTKFDGASHWRAAPTHTQKPSNSCSLRDYEVELNNPLKAFDWSTGYFAHCDFAHVTISKFSAVARKSRAPGARRTVSPCVGPGISMTVLRNPFHQDQSWPAVLSRHNWETQQHVGERYLAWQPLRSWPHGPAKSDLAADTGRK